MADSDERPRVVKLAVSHLPGSGKMAELLHDCGIDSDAIVDRRAPAGGARTADRQRRRRGHSLALAPPREVRSGAASRPTHGHLAQLVRAPADY